MRSTTTELPLGLGVTSLTSSGDGIGYASRLLLRAVTELAGSQPRVLQLGDVSGPITRAQRVAFAARLWTTRAFGGPEHWLFNHLGLARAERSMPGVLRRRYAVVLNGVEAWNPTMSRSRLEAMMDADLRIAISGYTATRVAEAHPPVGPISVCPLALLPDELPTGKIDTGLLAEIGQNSVLILGRMSATERYKGHDQLLESWPRVLRVVPSAQLVIAGRGDDLERLRRKAVDIGIATNALFAGFVSDATLPHLLDRVSAFAMPSRGEGFGLVYLEAMRAGLPIIVSNDDAGRELVLDGQTGFTVDPLDLEGISATVIRLLTEPGLCRRLGDAGARRYRANYTFDAFRDRLAGILRGWVPEFGAALEERVETGKAGF